METVHDEIRALSVKMAAMEGRMGSIETGIADIKLGLGGLMELREDLKVFSVHHDQFKKEAQTMWTKLDGLRSEVDTLKEQRSQARGAIWMAGLVWVLLTAVGGSVLGWTWTQVQAVPVLAEKVSNLEQKAK